MYHREDCTLRVPDGQIVFATPGACCSPVNSTLPAVTVAWAAIPAAAISGNPTNAKPTDSAVRILPSSKFAFVSGSNVVTMD